MIRNHEPLAGQRTVSLDLDAQQLYDAAAAAMKPLGLGFSPRVVALANIEPVIEERDRNDDHEKGGSHNATQVRDR